MGNDIKMASEFQSIACAVTTVAADMLWKYLGVGEDMIQGSATYKRGLLSIYLVNLLTLLLGQAIARKQLHHKVGVSYELAELCDVALSNVILIIRSVYAYHLARLRN